MELNVLSVNLWGLNGPVAERMHRLAAHLEATHPDIVAMQEVEGWQGTSQASFLAREAGYAHVHETRTDRASRRGEGLAVITDLDSDPVDTVALPGAPDDHPRAAQLVDIATSTGTVVRMVNTHLTWQIEASGERTAQAQAIRDELSGWTGSIVLAGDLNDVPGSSALETLTEARDGYDPLVCACVAEGDTDAVTFDLANPYMDHPALADRRVDHVLVRGLDIAAATVVLDGRDSPVVSDHYGVLARLTATDS